LAAVVFYVVAVAFDLLAGESWGEALRSNIFAASMFAVFVAITFDLWPRAVAKRRKADS